jgi:hypothetical protein
LTTVGFLRKSIAMAPVAAGAGLDEVLLAAGVLLDHGRVLEEVKVGAAGIVKIYKEG